MSLWRNGLRENLAILYTRLPTESAEYTFVASTAIEPGVTSSSAAIEAVGPPLSAICRARRHCRRIRRTWRR